MNPKISRRDFVKGVSLLSLTPLLSQQPLNLDGLPTTSQPSAQAPNVLFIVFDTLSAPHTSLHGYARETTPYLERFAERSVVYHAHYAAANFTTPGTASLLTGTYPWAHRAFNHAGTLAEPYTNRNLFSAFGDGTYTRIAYTHNLLAESLLHQCSRHIDMHIPTREFCLYDGGVADQLFPRDAHHATRAVEDMVLRRDKPPSSLFVSLVDRVRQRFQKKNATDPYAERYPKGVPELFKLTFVLEDAIDGMTATIDAAPAPFLAYFHLLPPHEPYKPRREFVDRFKDGWQPAEKEAPIFAGGMSQKELNRLRREYDEYVAYADAEFGRLMDMLAQSGRLDDTIVVFTSDHGQLFERGIHGHVTQTLYDGLIRVPLLISLPGQQERTDVYTPTSCVDLLPTLLHLTGRDVPDWCEGRVLPAFADEESGPDRSVFAIEAKSNLKYAPLTQATVTLIKDRYKLTHYFGYGNADSEYELFDLADDPEERENIFSANRSLAAELQDELEAQTAQVNQAFVS